MELKDKVVVITGSSRGIGKATALEFGRKKSLVVVNYIRDDKAARNVVETIGADRSLLIKADVSSEKQVKHFIGKVIDKYERIDVLVNNAGEIFRPGDWHGDENTWQRTIDVNLTSAWLMIKHVAPIMQKQKTGSIINITSVYGFLGAAPVAAYTAAKGGLITLTKSMAKELAPYIRVNAVAPSNVMTDMTKGAGDKLINYFKDQTPLKRIADPEELAYPIIFLASDEASYITGEVLVVDGGYSLK